MTPEPMMMNTLTGDPLRGSRSPSRLAGRLGIALAFAAIPALLAAFFLVQDYFSYSYLSGAPFPLQGMAIYELMVFYTWAALFPLLRWLIRRAQDRRRVDLATVFLAGVPIAFIHRAITVFVVIPINMPGVFAEGVPAWLYKKILAGSFSSLVECWLIIVGYLGFEYYRQYREQMLVTARLETQLAQAQLHALTAQLQPHFLFNTLHAISSLMDEDVQASRKMLTRLSDLLRQTLDSISTQEISLKQELEFLRGYLEIEQTRFADRLQVDYDVDNALLDAVVPKLILQPLVENAVRHGIFPKPEGGCLTIRARRDGRRLRLEVVDDGVGAGQGEVREGIGISNVRQRILQLYGPDYGLDLQARPDGGLLAAVTIPFRLSDEIDA